MNENINTPSSSTPFRGRGGRSILIIDNYDSFTYNLVHLVNELGLECEVWRNDQFAIEDVDAFDKIILSPGPGIPSEAGLLLDVIAKYAPTKSIFGVCLGQQAIAEVFGGSLYNLNQPMHGIATPIKVTNGDEELFAGLPDSFKVGRYHSWVVSGNDLPDSLQVTAIDEADNSIMALKHKQYDVRGVQFHPESILTDYGKEMMQNWLKA
ncbi:aminodeoxychorismate/anthranilate synthase component II [Mucilaginibacter rubeus]|uniref:Aminodeoxychorismate/anthranilate synthase component II n=1 Tax=Mucilaginibacter rubeus TaxID=2027860 RepID=A0AAE6ML37_9SPHI|nr:MULTISPECIES: aminodeoxychorismate/anthranilate synthase component II [Mucilaginibacter]QEM07458.1 aminodeoxychorismate/anthranilate synthase component II [Mucilaginibacter rubeus]QEM19911.1 aminodeoxychorismate/anthranilate synthase component II [Mucilaginibacter gossypii]QTE43382.1 aminodeoxychorismate/anthranilate synthase component II [Mucilaginibacter rubeus]QTE49982.1 aminodeoxychorismate/anthranilate synthase component II [Mucilaginibacter rubeus]QTE55073.1 aminodeoxychorismate/anthr